MDKAGRLYIAVCILVGLGGHSPTFGQTPTSDEIVAKFLEKAARDSLYIGGNYTHEELEITDNLKNGVIVEKEEKLYVARKDGGIFYKRLVSRDGIPVHDSKFKLKEETIPISPEFFNRYLFTFGRVETFEGRKCWVLSFGPKKNFPEKKPKDRILNNLAGEVWIVQVTFDFAKLTCHLVGEVSYAWPGFVGGKAKKVESVITGGLINSCFVVNYVRVEYEYSAKALFWPKNVHSIKTIHYQNYKRRDTR